MCVLHYMNRKSKVRAMCGPWLSLQISPNTEGKRLVRVVLGDEDSDLISFGFPRK